MSGENDDEAVDLGFSVGYPAWDEAKFAVSDVVSGFTDDKLGTCIGTQILWPISVWLWDVGDCHLFITDCERLVLPCNWNSRDSMLEDPPKCFISIVSPNLFFGILVGANHFHWNRPTGDRSPTCYWGHGQPIFAVDGHHYWVFTSFSVWTLAKSMSDSGLYRRKPPWCHEDMMGSPCHTPLYKEIYVFVDSGC
jgi:hypothetical protein